MARVPVTCSGPRRPGHWLSDSVRRCDEALRLSKRFQGYQRAGDVTPQIVVVNGLDSIDVSAVDTSFSALTTHGFGNHAVRTEQWRYIRYRDGGEELYDEKKDPFEWTNLAADPAHRKVKAALAERFPKVDAPRGRSDRER